MKLKLGEDEQPLNSFENKYKHINCAQQRRKKAINERLWSRFHL